MFYYCDELPENESSHQDNSVFRRNGLLKARISFFPSSRIQKILKNTNNNCKFVRKLYSEIIEIISAIIGKKFMEFVTIGEEKKIHK